MSNINAASGSHYLSNAEIMAWMQEKTDGIYAHMGNAMDTSNDRADAEDALNNIQSEIANVQAGKADGNALYGMVDEAIKKYGEEFPELKDTLGTISKELSDMGAKLADPDAAPGPAPYITPAPPRMVSGGMAGERATPDYDTWYRTYGVAAQEHPELVMSSTPPQKITVDEGTAKRWTDAIKNRVDAFGKDDQLSLINIQEFNAQLNQAKQTASALMDSADKSANTIINHIS